MCPASTETYTLSLHDALPIWVRHEATPESLRRIPPGRRSGTCKLRAGISCEADTHRSEEHTSELQSQFHLVCRLLLEKKKATCRGSKCATPRRPTTATSMFRE